MSNGQPDDRGYDSFELNNGVRVATGLIVPDRQPIGDLPLYADNKPLLSDDDFRSILRAGVPSDEEIFGNEIVGKAQVVGSCGACAAGNLLSRHHFLKTGKVRLAYPEWAYAAVSGGRDHGSVLIDVLHWMQDHGMPWLPNGANRNAYAKRQIDHWSQYTEQAKQNRFEGGFELIRGGNGRPDVENAWRAVLSACARMEFPVIAIHCGRRFGEFSRRPKDRLMKAPADSGPGNHAVAVSMIAGDPDFRNIRELSITLCNSWSTSFGYNGRCYLGIEHIENTFTRHQFYASESVTEDSGLQPLQP